MSERIVIATRGSKLALWQAHAVERALIAAEPGLEVSLLVVKTTGDVTLDRPLDKIGDKGMFVQQLEAALLSGEADLAVHSLKDVPSELSSGCALVAVPTRADARDCLVCSDALAGVRSLAELPAGARVGTGSLRRVAQLRAQYPKLEVLGIRGNVDTRLAKLDAGAYDALVLASAGVERMGLSARIAARIPVEQMVPAAGQGALGVEAREDDARVGRLAALIDDAEERRCTAEERTLLAALGGSCKVPLGAHVRAQGTRYRLDAVVLSPDGARCARTSCVSESGAGPEGLSTRALADLEAQDARAILAEALDEAGE